MHELFKVDSETTVPAVTELETVLEKRDIQDVAMVLVTGGPQRLVIRESADAQGMVVLIPGAGGGELEIDGRIHSLREKRAYVLDLRCACTMSMNDRFEHLSLILPPRLSASARAFFRSSHGSPVLLESGSAALFAATVSSSFHYAPTISNESAAIVARSLVALLNAALAEAAGEAHRATPGFELDQRTRIIQYVSRELADHDLSVASVAAALRMSPRRIHQLFASAEMSLMRWVWSERLAQCRSCLVQGALLGRQIGDIAYECGFGDTAHFSRVFRRRYGESPSQYVKRETSAVLQRASASRPPRGGPDDLPAVKATTPALRLVRPAHAGRGRSRVAAETD
jgi:AraC family transcriptional activator of tynA and feaB